MKVNEIFLSIEGEGIRTGQTAVFVRLYGCNLRCTYCDTLYACAGSDYTDMRISEIVDKVAEFNCPRVTVTGGEPLLRDTGVNLIAELCKTYEVNVETNGSFALNPLISQCKANAHGDRNLIITMDWKSFSSGMASQMYVGNLPLLRGQDVLKFVVSDKKDLDQMAELIRRYRIAGNIFVSPVFGKIEPREIVEYVIKNNLHEVSTQVQLHKIIWDPNKRGV